MKHIDSWYHESYFVWGELAEDAIPTHTDNLPLMDVVVGLDANDEPITEKQIDTRDFHVSIDEKRVTGHAYTPYKKGSDLWRDAANALLAAIANDNFTRR